eukprot:TRINITY_DN572_c0_g1_i2.p4 TRINITY_DN572_c0_g1~~TRINITY_DN572_c0_g1_i2.p4  ORF type:complete len:50 (-),score=3.34 TRINITY_DN572_c0_g1_i2:114-263(-)
MASSSSGDGTENEESEDGIGSSARRTKQYGRLVVRKQTDRHLLLYRITT